MDYQQQSHYEPPTQTQAPTSQQSGGVSNSAELEECGLDTAAPAEEGLFDEFAEVVLSAVPMEAALPMAAAQIDKPGVQQWVLQQDAPRMVQAMARVLPDRLIAQWPVGTGLFAKGSGKVAALFGGTLNGEVELLHSAPGQLSARAKAGGTFGIDQFGAALKAEGGGERAIAALSATGGVAAQVGLNGSCTAPMDTALLMALGAMLSPAAVLSILGGSKVMGLASSVTGMDLPDLLPETQWDIQKRAALVANAAVTGGEEALDFLSPADLSQLLADLKPYLDSLNGLFSASYTGQVELLLGTGGATVNVRHRVAATAELAAIPALAQVFDLAALEQLSEALGGAGQIELSAGLRLNGPQAVLEPRGRATLHLESSRGNSSQTDQMHFFLDQLPALAEQLKSGQGLEAMLAGAGFDRKVELPAPRELVQQVLSQGALVTADLMADNYVAAGWEDFNLVSSLSMGPAVLGALAGIGLCPPAGMPMTQAMQDVQAGLCALVCGLPPAAAWLGPWLPAMQRAVAGVILPAPRLMGRLSFGLGFGASASGGPSVGGDAKGAAGMVVDREVGQIDSGPLRKALAGL